MSEFEEMVTKAVILILKNQASIMVDVADDHSGNSYGFRERYNNTCDIYSELEAKLEREGKLNEC